MPSSDIYLVSDDTSQLAVAPEIDASELVVWIFHPGTQIKVAGPARQIMALPAAQQLGQLIQMAREEDCSWALLDGPRQTRSQWLLDLWWEERPEMPKSLLQATQARAVKLADLQASLGEYVQA
jgi:hypothetical protein